MQPDLKLFMIKVELNFLMFNPFQTGVFFLLTRLLSYKITICFMVVCLGFSAIILLLARYADGFAQRYAVNVYPVISEYGGRISSQWNYSIFEAAVLSFLILVVLLPLSGLLHLLFCVMIRRKSGSIRKKIISVSLRLLICSVSVLVLVYSAAGAVNYHRNSIGTVLSLPVKESSMESLVKLSMLLAEDLTALTEDPDWDYSLLTVKDSAYIETQAIYAMKQLGKQEPSLAGYYSKPKSVYFSEVLSDLGIEGIFSPFTMEANYNKAMTPFLIPYTICHELAHYKGYMKEDDAGFIAFLACKNSPSMVFQYSGMFHALIFTLNALKTEADPEEFNDVYQKLPEPVRIQLGYIKEQRQQQTTSFTAITKSVNDLYLKANAQEGMKSYGQMVDLLIADYADRIEQKNLI